MGELELRLSTLPKTWIIDIDGVIFPHNGYMSRSASPVENPLPGVVDFISKIPDTDTVILTSSRSSSLRELTEKSLRANGIAFDLLVLDLPPGQRILIDDCKPSGLKTAYSVNLVRDTGLEDVSLQADVRM